jgi:CHAT domain-containing protein
MQSSPARGAAERGLVAVSNGEAGKAQTLPVRGATQDLPALPYARAEAEAVAALSPGKATVLSDAGATEPAVLKLAGDAGKLHFAVHSVFNPVTPLDSGLVLRPVTGSSEAATDGFLQAWEIFDGWRIQSELVTLSACDTGLGERVADEGLVGLTRAFQYAGAKNVVASLWSVSDRSTAELMIRFYRELARGEPADPRAPGRTTLDAARARASRHHARDARCRRPGRTNAVPVQGYAESPGPRSRCMAGAGSVKYPFWT